MYIVNSKNRRIALPGGFPRAWAWCVGCLLLGFVPAHATSVVPVAFPELVREADYVVRAVVKSSSCREQIDATGSRLVYTSVALEVKSVLAGLPPNPLVLQLLGGQVGDYRLTVEGAPTLLVGDEGYFFVQGNGAQIYPLVRMMHGLYRIERDASGHEYISRSDHTPLRQIAAVGQPPQGPTDMAAARSSPAAALSPADFERAIQGQLSAPPRREK